MMAAIDVVPVAVEGFAVLDMIAPMAAGDSGGVAGRGLLRSLGDLFNIGGLLFRPSSVLPEGVFVLDCEELERKELSKSSKETVCGPLRANCLP